MKDIHEILKAIKNENTFFNISNVALAKLKNGNPTKIEEKIGKDFDLAKNYYRTYSIRQSTGYFDKYKVLGLKETLNSLRKEKERVRLCYLLLEQIILIIWLNESDKVCGLIVQEVK